MVIAGATTGMNPPADLAQVFFLQRSIVGSTMGTLHELERLARFCVTRGVHPAIDSVMPLAHARDALAKMQDGEVSGKIVLTP
jgi:D-arabinose 1-dehydrogenase-like Zn-dependent alcohol dehydrogenase